jgi:hypothetical protein
MSCSPGWWRCRLIQLDAIVRERAAPFALVARVQPCEDLRAVRFAVEKLPQRLGPFQCVAAEYWPSHSVLPVVRHEERKAPRNATQVLLVPDRLSREEELAHENIVHLLAVLELRVGRSLA